MEREKLRVLLIEEDERDYKSIEALLTRIPGAGYALDWARSHAAALEALQSECHDVCLLDYDREGKGILGWARDCDCRIPFIVLTGQSDHTADLRAMQEGAFDFFAKNEATPWLLERSIRYAVERKRTEEALRESEERFRFMAENSGDALYRLRYETMRYDYLSPSIEILTGYSREEVNRIGFSLLVLRIETVRKENVSPAQLREQRLAGRTGEHRADYLIRTKSGALKWLSDHSVPWLDRTGSLVGSTGILADITERRQAEDAVLASERQLRVLSSKLLNVQEAERTRLARNLHDTVGQSLAAVKYGVENALGVRGRNRASDMLQSLEPVVPVLQNLIESVRGIYMDLRPTLLDDFGIVAAIEWLCREFQSSQPDITLEKEVLAEEERIPEALKSIIFRIARDALENIAKHSRAGNAHLSLRTTDTGIELEVRDDGIGFDPDGVAADGSPSTDGLGICSMRERASLSGGTFAILTQSGKGTVLKASWPHGEPVSP